MKILLLNTLLISVHISNTFLLKRRRRAPAPVPVDCELSDWQTVQPCTTECGPEGEEVQQRRIVRDGRNGGTMCSEYKTERTLSCNRICYNDGKLNYDLGKCDCSSGWTGECCDQDVDECTDDPSICSQVCVNTLGSYHCNCQINFTLDTDNKNCVDLEECQKTPPPCAHRCKELDGGGYQCYCDDGYVLDTDGSKCNDINECKTGNVCQFSCVNIPGDYQCECTNGFFRNTDLKTCTDVDECAVDNGGCEQECVNTEGGYRCTCAQGYSLNQDMRKCDDINECELHGQTLCEQLCVDIRGSYTCACVKPFMLNSDMRTCSCVSNDKSECDSAQEQVQASRAGTDKDTMYSWIIGVLIIACMVLVLMLLFMGYRKGYHRLLIPKPPPISTIPRHNNVMFSPDLIDEGEASGDYEEPDALYEELPDDLAYMDISDEKGGKDAEVKMAENDYVEAIYDAEPGCCEMPDDEYQPMLTPFPRPSRNSVYIDASTADILPRDPPNDPSRDIPLDQDGDYSRRADDEGFTFEDDDLHRPYDNI